MNYKRKDFFNYIKSDYIRYGKVGGDGRAKIILYALSGRNVCFSFSFWFRLCQCKNVFYPIALIKYQKYKRKYGFLIPLKTQIGYGLYISHGIGIVLNPTTVIGNNVNLSQFTTIGSNHNTSAIIGDNVYIGPSVCIIESVRIGNNVTVGAGAVVTKDIPDNATVAGVPAKVLNYNNPGRYVNNKWVCVRDEI